ncbi:hypothetical protein DPMN_089101 [Dreissena polymorpha]|uniref:Uncharacterized protein n=1 Tax=Dreissena polymorpha TaxID=45954 RepID=A0A9D4QX46_DREPO|nr:hypothetical protein DPMN_089101 [Dreissena polymorpha]
MRANCNSFLQSVVFLLIQNYCQTVEVLVAVIPCELPGGGKVAGNEFFAVFL